MCGMGARNNYYSCFHFGGEIDKERFEDAVDYDACCLKRRVRRYYNIIRDIAFDIVSAYIHLAL